MSKNWGEFDRFGPIINKYMPVYGEGETMASQICTAVNKLVYKWYNDGDVYDNTGYMEGWCNDLSSYANWLQKYAGGDGVMELIFGCSNESRYEDLLYLIAEEFIDETYLERMNEVPAEGTIYKCDGPFKFEEPEEEEDEEW